jgi:hypothetical protein
MSSPKGWTSQEKLEFLRQQFATIEPVRRNQFAMSVLSHLFVKDMGSDIVEAGSTTIKINATAHAAVRGDVIKFTSGALNGIEVKVVDHAEYDNVIPANIITLAESLSVAPSATDTFTILRHGFPLINSSGSMNVASTGAALQFLYNSVLTDVIEDSGTPANNRPLPVKITSASGPINITAGDLNVQLSHAGASYDSTRLGDGTNLLGITASNEAKTLDATTHTKLDAVVAKDFATQATLASILTELQLKADLLETQPVSVATLPLPTGSATSANQSTEITALGSLLTELQLKADLTETQPVSGPLTDVQLRASAVPVSAASLPLPSGASTSANQSTEITALNNLLTELQNKADLAETQPVSMSTLPTGTNTIGKVDVNTLSVVDLVDANILDTSSTNIPGSSGSPVTLTASLAANVKKLQFIDTTGGFIGLYTGAAASEVLILVIGPGSDSIIEHSITSGTRISAKRLDSTTALSSGILAINFIG